MFAKGTLKALLVDDVVTVALVDVDAVPVNAPLKVVALKVPVEGLKDNLVVETFELVIVPVVV